jgi:cytochrome c556
MDAMFGTVETYFVQKGDAANAVDLTKKSRDLTLTIVGAVTSGDYDAATDAATTLSRTCKTCHTFYKKE